MEIIENVTRKLIPSEGHCLTQAKEVDLQERIVSKKIILSATDDAANYKEITVEEGERIISEKENERLRLAAETETERLRADLQRQLAELDKKEGNG